ncbi:hypothetical protein WDW86_21460 [Bdellovibrionota bacterium FG-2]
MRFKMLVCFLVLGLASLAQVSQAAQVETGRGTYEITSAQVISAGASCYLVSVGYDSRTPLRDCFSIGCFFDPEEADQMAAILMDSNDAVLTVKKANDCKINDQDDWELN